MKFVYGMAISLFLTAAVIHVAYGAPQDSWINPITFAARSELPILDLPSLEFAEISVSTKRTAENWLSERKFRAIESRDIEFFGQAAFSCVAQKKPFLIRAVYANGGSGRFLVRRYGENLQVSYDTLGSASEAQRSALIVCLEFEPKDIYNIVSFTM